MVEVPVTIACASPTLLIVATFVAEEFQVVELVKFRVLPAEAPHRRKLNRSCDSN